ncbi:pleckstrin homology-like domain-containing protein [Danio aesculapii]|uniref:pleckstrin homology-like domain-containing protein n=1 Tax=Danio aesculapii TaxID=1142201 RepID=UPI0024BFD19E|nr:pleckstrin homology-like domain-containing protein [Danio aesculapii]
MRVIEKHLGAMALESATSNGKSDENHPEECKGWLFKKTHYTRRWKMLWFHLKDGKLIYGLNEESAEKVIDLAGARMEVQDGDGSFCWSVRPKGGKRVYLLRAANAAEQRLWMTAILETQLMTGVTCSNACVLQ